MVCLRPPEDIRAEWAALGLGGVDGPGFDAHLDAVSRRMNVNVERTQPNRTNVMMAEALEARGLTWEVLPRNASPDDDPAFCGYCNAGCQQGCKQSALKTYLQDASDAGARVVVDCVADRVLVADGRATGVAARARAANGELVDLRVDAPVVVVAAGGIESPAVLLRSQLGGPAAGAFLRLHPTYFVGGVYDEVVNAWDGQFQALASFDFTRVVEGTGFLVESVNVSLPFWAGALAVRGRRGAQGADAAPAQRRLLARRHARPRIGRASCSEPTASPSSAGSSTIRSTGSWPPACTSSSRACTTRAAPRRS